MKFEVPPLFGQLQIAVLPCGSGVPDHANMKRSHVPAVRSWPNAMLDGLKLFVRSKPFAFARAWVIWHASWRSWWCFVEAQEHARRVPLRALSRMVHAV